MATFLTLQAPEPRDAQPLLSRLLDDGAGRRLDGLLHGEPVVRGSRLPAGFAGVVDLDANPRTLPEHAATRYDLRPASDELAEALALPLPAPRVVFAMVGAERVVDAGYGVGLDLNATVNARQVADFLAVLVHTEVGFVARVADAAGVLQVLAATVAALRGDDVAAAWRAPDVVGVRGVSDPAARALREVLRSIEVPDACEVVAALAGSGLAQPRR
ncbi:MAG: hypothetical protein ABI251_09790 [Mycobacteriaceae bacterium]